MNRPTRKVSEQKRTAILAAAIDLFASHGFDHVSMDAIAENAHVSKRTVYNHFNSKDALFLAILGRLQHAATSIEDIVYRNDLPLRQQLVEYGRQIIEFHCCPEARRLARVILPRLVRHPELGVEMMGEARIFQNQLVRWIRSAQRAQRFRKTEPSTAALQYLGLLEAFTVWPQLLKGSPDPSTARRKKIAIENTELFLSFYEIEQVA